MANPDHVNLIKSESKEKIFAWRKENPHIRVDLSNAVLNDISLFDLDLSGADMRGLHIDNGRLNCVKLVGTSICGAEVRTSVFVSCDLSRARLAKTQLSECRFEHTILNGTDLTDVMLTNQKFVGCDLSKCVGLSTVTPRHFCSFDVDTLIQSFVGAGQRFNKELRAFFRNAEVEKEVLEAIPQLFAKAKYCSCFVCYGEPDKKFAERLTERLKIHGVSCWIYSLDATPGKSVWGEISEKMEKSEKTIILCSARSLVRDGVKKEIEKQKDKDPTRMIAISLDDIWNAPGFVVQRGDDELKTFLMLNTWADFTHCSKRDESFKKLLKGLRK